MTELTEKYFEPIADFLEKLKTEIEHGPETDSSTCETGDEVVTVAWSNTGHYFCKEGESKARFETPALAWNFWLLAFDLYRENRKGKIYWRIHPTMITDRVYGGELFLVRARCFIAEK